MTQPQITVLTDTNKLTGTPNGPPGIEKVEQVAKINLATDQASLEALLPETEVLLVTDFRTQALAKAWPSTRQLKWIHTTSAGVDHLRFPALQQSQVQVTNARGFFDRAIAEYVLGVILAFAKDTRTNIKLQEQQQWQHRDTETIHDKNVLIVGAGSIGRCVGSLCRAVGMQVTGLARSYRPGDDVFEAIYPTDQIHDHLPNADYVVITAPLNAGTQGLFDAQAFAKMQPMARLINVGRGPIVQTQALLDALVNKQIAAAALDVYEQEPLPKDHPLWQQENVLMSAHMAGDFIGWREALIDQFLANYARWQAGQPLENIVSL